MRVAPPTRISAPHSLGWKSWPGMLVLGKLWSASRNLHAWHQVEVDLGLHLVPHMSHMSQPGDASTESPEALAETWGCRWTTWARHTWQLVACKRKKSKTQLERHLQKMEKTQPEGVYGTGGACLPKQQISQINPLEKFPFLNSILGMVTTLSIYLFHIFWRQTKPLCVGKLEKEREEWWDIHPKTERKQSNCQDFKHISPCLEPGLSFWVVGLAASCNNPLQLENWTISKCATQADLGLHLRPKAEGGAHFEKAPMAHGEIPILGYSLKREGEGRDRPARQRQRKTGLRLNKVINMWGCSLCSRIATTQSGRERAFTGKYSDVDCDGDYDASKKDTLRHRTDLPYVILNGLNLQGLRLQRVRVVQACQIPTRPLPYQADWHQSCIEPYSR